jgi:hypothetical protein
MKSTFTNKTGDGSLSNTKNWDNFPKGGEDVVLQAQDNTILYDDIKDQIYVNSLTLVHV